MTRKKKEPSKFRAFLTRLSARSEAEWEIDRFSFWPAIVILVILAIGYASGYMLDAHDFVVQTWVFGLIATGLGAIGITVGYKHPYRQNLWVTADLIWLFATIFTLGSALAVVDSYFASQRIERAQISVAKAHRNLMNVTGKVADLQCSTQQASVCKQWLDFQRNVALPIISTEDINAINSSFKAIATSARPNEIEAISARKNELFNEQKKYGELKPAATNIDLLSPYAYILFMSLALGFRAATSGAELARSHIDKKTREAAHNPEVDIEPHTPESGIEVHAPRASLHARRRNLIREKIKSHRTSRRW